MELFTANIFISFIHLLITAIDILSFFVLARLLSYKCRYQWLQAFDAVGKPLIEWYGAAAQTFINRFNRKVNSKQALLAWGLLFLVVIRWILTVFFNTFILSITPMSS